jgi:hypothetical protein
MQKVEMLETGYSTTIDPHGGCDGEVRALHWIPKVDVPVEVRTLY